ncbi:Hint domain-containing protein [Rhodovulum imhoffii]|uniref:Hint domain-containing protein n=1 Tax=Rhodovulum imhoffii TaxID=365340 RepID=A0A2T5BDR5_9RHOB|nr:Hint domain-containing protein [Rhodovulum imhoffii]PTM97135.1 Hint domain-containing protein [Rhodovulum imhoffii]
MGTSTAFISEMYYRSNEGTSEFLEVTLRATEDPADYTVSFYKSDGTLETAIPVTDAVGGEITLDAASVTAVPDPDNPNYIIYTITSNTGYLFTGGTTFLNEARAVTLTNTNTGTVIDAYTVNGGTVTTTEGAGSGVTTSPSGSAGPNQSVQWDVFGNRTFGTLTPDDAVLCFDSNAMIQTTRGEIRAGDLEVGDLVATMDHGYQPILWVHETEMLPEIQVENPKVWPIRISQGALGANHPRKDLTVSPQHRIVLRSMICERMFGTTEVLVNAKSLLAVDGVTQEQPTEKFYYVHVLLERHEIIFANGHPSESLLPGEMVLEALTQNDREILKNALSETALSSKLIKPVRPIVKGREVKKMIKRHQKNNKPLFDSCLGQGQALFQKSAAEWTAPCAIA